MYAAKHKVLVPLDVPKKSRRSFMKNYLAVTKNSGRLLLFAGDQRVEHMNDDFAGPGIHADDANPVHFFNIASRAKIGVFATQLGLISRYGMDFRSVDYLVKLNSKTNVVPASQKEPFSDLLTSVEQVVEFQKSSKLKIRGVGYTLYIGSEHEPEMLKTASQIITRAHKHGLVVVLWIYLRGKAVKDEYSADLIAGAAGVACCLGADFVKLNCPRKNGKSEVKLLESVVCAAGRTKIVVVGGSTKSPEQFLKEIHSQLEIGSSGNAIGRNIHQKGLADAIRLSNAAYALIVENKSLDDAIAVWRGQ